MNRAYTRAAVSSSGQEVIRRGATSLIAEDFVEFAASGKFDRVWSKQRSLQRCRRRRGIKRQSLTIRVANGQALAAGKLLLVQVRP